MADRRDAKRIRQACENCRRKKTRCSGERPVCSFCARLGQTCRYNDSYSSDPATSSYNCILQQENSGLATRVALLESRLSLLDANGSNGATLSSLFGGSPLPQAPGPDAQVLVPSSSELTSLLDAKTLQSLADVYFLCCHQQPYSFFHETTFRQNLENGSLPSYLLLAFVATAVRFSQDIRFAGRQTEATDWYAKLAWSAFVEEAFSDAHSLNISTVQAASMLGFIDYICGRDQLAWVKFGLSIQFARTLQLGTEPDASLAPNKAEERSRTFWSVYILDRLSSCGRNRPPTLLDSDCTSRLPLNQYPLRDPSIELPTLAAIREIPDRAPLESTDHFALTIFMVSAFGDIVRWAFKHSAAKSRLPWDARSEFSRTNGMLSSFESYSDACDGNFAEIIDRDFVSQGKLDECAACHFSYAHILYHVNQCLLHHPFLLRQHLRSLSVKIPANFLRASVSTSKEHATYLTAILRALQQRGCKIYPSFYGYAAALAGMIHRIHARNPHNAEQLASEANWESCVRFLDQEPVFWESYRRMSGVLKDFDPAPSLAASLLSSSFDPTSLDPDTEEHLWHLSDYSWLTNSARRPSMSNLASRPELENMASTYSPELQNSVSAHSPDFETLLEGALSFDFGMLNQVPSNTSIDGSFRY
ncbi:fungal-specific transcription factor domain-containing protein [Pyrenochaeta sp. MPI-SDFR-AT-0127]|nr:fungal-specific transcription factor domain-containing protein [Pyrenochaeta sp. MPI-SDFR-AT-0127]